MSNHRAFLRNNLYGNAQLVLQKCGLNAIAEKLCNQFNLGIAKDLCALTDEDIDKIPWLRRIQSAKLKEVCAICRETHIEEEEAERNARLERARIWDSQRHSVFNRNGDLHALLDSLVKQE